MIISAVWTMRNRRITLHSHEREYGSIERVRCNLWRARCDRGHSLGTARTREEAKSIVLEYASTVTS